MQIVLIHKHNNIIFTFPQCQLVMSFQIVLFVHMVLFIIIMAFQFALTERCVDVEDKRVCKPPDTIIIMTLLQSNWTRTN